MMMKRGRGVTKVGRKDDFGANDQPFGDNKVVRLLFVELDVIDYDVDMLMI